MNAPLNDRDTDNRDSAVQSTAAPEEATNAQDSLETALVSSCDSSPLAEVHPDASRANFGRFSWRIASGYFTEIPVPDQATQAIRNAEKNGDVVHVMHTSNVLGAFFLSWFLPTHGLRPLETAIGLARPYFWKPIQRLIHRGNCSTRINTALDDNKSALVFLNTPSGLVPRPTPLADPFFALIDRAKKSDRPLYLIPETLVWSARPPSLRPGLKEFLLGSAEAPHRLVSAWGFVNNYKNTYFRTGEPIDLTDFVRRNASESYDVLVPRIRGLIAQELVREMRAIVGPPAKPRERLIEETLRDRELKAAIEDAAVEKNRTQESQLKTARRYLREIASKPELPVIKLVVGTLDLVFRRIFLSVEVDDEGFEKALESSRTTPVIYCPSHKSHLDYLLLGWLFVQRGLMPTLVAAGANLSFWPLGPILRRSGAYFLRRTFKGNRLYASVFRTYIKKLMREGYNQEFFIEGGRSRTGKTLKPKLGMVDFVVTGFLEGAQEDVTFVPVALDYEKVLELKSYTKELTGGEKKPESLTGLLTAPKALASRYGRIYISFGEPFSLRDFIQGELGEMSPKDLPLEKHREITRKLAERITHGIDGASTVTPAALIAAAILSHRGGRCSSAQLETTIQHLMSWIGRGNGRLSQVIDSEKISVHDSGPIRQVLRMWQSDRLIQADVQGDEIFFHVPNSHRLELSFYKNNLLHTVLHPAIVASILLTGDGTTSASTISFESLRQAHEKICHNLRMEFSFDPEKTFHDAMIQALQSMSHEGMIELHRGEECSNGEIQSVSVTPGGEEVLRQFASLLGDLLASYLLTALNLKFALEPISKKDLVKKIIEAAHSQISTNAKLVPEALSKPVLASAVDLFVEDGILQKVKDGKQVVLTDTYRGEDQRQSLIQELEKIIVVADESLADDAP